LYQEEGTISTVDLGKTVFDVMKIANKPLGTKRRERLGGRR
jgi:hypothetical protein